MSHAYKNFWSLNTDEAVVTGILRGSTEKNTEVLMPINAQMKDIDLVLYNIENRKNITIQVKWSRAYEPKKSEVKKYWDGSAGWFFLKKDTIHKSTADYFIFLIYVLEEDIGIWRRFIVPHTLTIPTRDLCDLSLKYKKLSKDERYNFFFWINPKKKTAIDFRDELFDLTPYLDGNGFSILNTELR